ncbi:mediator of RNA polymerase II transcription subunit 14 isoform X1 [Cynara cardunculus var. scolymus]|uniref:mediator of RNA polymerase II transcription subunit 14 isoform X1 n=1 Tax=Cynara cardunculus var. scolymus TaxID=59895 RepID=UPI000D62305A|nr:mediator of RNA polymerase II transcription subunit 14 isoform X1 [Cynara cardunculus var. scolymus]
MAEIGQESVEFSTLVSRAAEESYLSLKELVEKSKSSDMSDSEKKISILKYLVKTQQRMLRLNVLAQWCQQVPLIQYCQQLASTLSSHETCFTQAADSMFFMHEGLQQARAPIYDVPSAIEVLLTGTYQRLPKCTEDVGIQSTLTDKQQKPVLKKLDTIVRSKLLETSLPKEFSEVKIFDGTVHLCVQGEFKVLLTLGYRGHLSMWRILHLEVLVGERSGLVKLEETRRFVLGDDLERRMAASDSPFATMYSILHEFCVALIMDTVIRQVQALRLGRWKDAIRFELISDGNPGQGSATGSVQMNQDGETDSGGLRTPGLKILYWLDCDKNNGTSDAVSCPFIKIEPGQDLRIKCLHSAFVIDPLTNKEAEFSIDQSCIDVEKLLLRAIWCNKFTRLLEIYKELGENSHIRRAAGDVLLHCPVDQPGAEYKADNKSDSEGQEVLRVRAYGSSFFTLGINIRTGRFLLHSSRSTIAPSALRECEEALNQGSITAAEAFISLRSKSFLHLFACIGRFLGLQVYEHGFSPVKVPKHILNGSNMLLMGFPDCGSSYFLLMQLEEDFRPLFKLLETQADPPGKPESSGVLNQVTRIKNVDVNQMHMLEDELNLSLLDYGALTLPANAVGTNQTSENGLSDLSVEGSGLLSAFSSIVDEVFEQERRSSAPAFPVQSFNTTFNTTTNHGSGPTISSSPKWEGGPQMSHIDNPAGSSWNGALYPTSNYKGRIPSVSTSSIAPAPGRSTVMKKLPASKSDQDLASRSPHSAEVGSYITMEEDQLGVAGSRSSRLSSLPQSSGPRVSAASARANAFRNSVTGTPAPAPDSPMCTSSLPAVVSKYDNGSRKRALMDMLDLLPSLKCPEILEGSFKRRKITNSVSTQRSSLQTQSPLGVVNNIEKYRYVNLIAEANKGDAPSSIYVSALLHVVRHCSLCIKHARLTSQMDELNIPYAEEVGLRNASSNIWFRLPFARGDAWEHICLRLGRPGSMYWDVKINDQHFMDLWELQKGSTSTPWGSGVRIANTSDIDSHIRYYADGVVLTYNSVESDSIKKLVADIQRLSNARTFALGMRKLLIIKSDEKTEESRSSSDAKAPPGAKSTSEAVDKYLEQMRRAFKIEAVGLMSLWFSFGSGVLARFVVEWESGKSGCTMHVSPDQLWPHTKFLEDFINGTEVSSLLDCIRLTAGPLHALAAATRPARAAPVSGVPGSASSVPTLSKASVYGQMPNNSNNVGHSSAPGGNPGASAISTLGTHGHHGSAMLTAASAAGRGGPGIVPSSLLPIDVSFVLRGPYWIRIIYRKYFAVDMRCFAGDQVWLQPATPPKGGPTVGGSLPCPQFRPFIMEHVAQELNGLDPNFTGGQQSVGPTNSNNSGAPSSPQVSASNGNRVSLAGPTGMSRPGNQPVGFSRATNAMPTSSTSSLGSSGLALRRPPGTVVPAHVRGELNTAIIGLGDDGGYGGGWVPLVALKKVLRGILKYLGVLWLFAQLPELLKEILGSILKDNEGALLNLDQEQPALRFFVGGYVFAVSVHRVQLLLQVLSVKRFHHSQQQQQNSVIAQEELSQSEIGEICDYFSRRVASEPYDASRVASFITLLTLPISVLREFLKLIAWKKGLVQTQGGDIPPAQRSRIELCLENHSGLYTDGNSDNSSVSKSNIHYDRPHNAVDFGLTVVLDPAHIPHINAAGGAAWLPYCVSVRLKYSFGDNPSVCFLGMEGSHGGRSCWLRLEDWEYCKQRVIRMVDMNGSSGGDANQGRLRMVADNVQRALHLCLQGLRTGGGGSSGGGGGVATGGNTT